MTGLTLKQVELIRLLHRLHSQLGTPATLDELAAALRVGKVTVHGRLELLSLLGIVTPGGGNTVHRCRVLTPFGLRVLRDLVTPLKRLREAWADASAEECKLFLKGLKG